MRWRRMAVAHLSVRHARQFGPPRDPCGSWPHSCLEPMAKTQRMALQNLGRSCCSYSHLAIGKPCFLNLRSFLWSEFL